MSHYDRNRVVKALAEKLEFFGQQTVRTPMFDGRIVTVKTDYDDIDPFTEYEDLGRVSEGYAHRDTGRNRRPDDFDGRACKLDTRHGPIWWQPPGEDYAPDDETREKIRLRVQDYLHEQWHYIVVTMRVGDAVASVGALESDSGDYFKEVLGDLLDELLPQDASKVCPCCKQPLPKKEQNEEGSRTQGAAPLQG